MTETRTRSLNSLKKGDTGSVLELAGPVPVVARLQELGMIRGATLEVIEILIFGEPIIVDVDQVRLALRKSEASCVTVSLSSTPSRSGSGAATLRPGSGET